MKTTIERLEELEVRIQSLEQEIQILRQKQEERIQPGQAQMERVPYGQAPGGRAVHGPISANRMQNGQMPYGPIPANRMQNGQMPYGPMPKQSAVMKARKDSESVVGKYITGALASLLIFIAAVSFIAIVWNIVSPQMKLFIVSIIGLTLTAVGLILTMKKPSNVRSILFGTGVGLVYISILSASLVFFLVRLEVSGVLSVIWTSLILFSYRYTKLYLTIAIASIGSFVNLCFQLGYTQDTRAMLLIILYTILITALLLYMSRTLGKVQNAVSIFFAFFSFAIIFLRVIVQWDMQYMLQLTLVMLAILFLTNWMYRLANRESFQFVHYILALFSTVMLFCYALLIFSDSIYQGGRVTFSVYLVVLLIQFYLNHLWYPNIEKGLSYFYAFTMYPVWMYFSYDIFSVFGMGAPAILLLFLIRKKGVDKSIPIPYMIFFVTADMFLNFREYNIWSLAFHIANLVLMFTLMYVEKVKRRFDKEIAFVILLCGLSKISYIFCELVYWDKEYVGLNQVLAQILCVLTVIVVHKIKYLHCEEEKTRYSANLGIYIVSTLLYYIGLFSMFQVDTMVLRFIAMLSTLTIALFQTYILYSDYETIPDMVGVWFVIKYFIFTWGVLRAFWEIPLDSVTYSVVGLLLAVCAIYAGFKLRIRSTRHFGLAITLLMVLKFILIDLHKENSITRVLSFAVGGVLCFLISVIYNRLSKE